MILVELDTGSQRLFGSHEELVAAIRRGELSSESRIYHRLTAQWLPITVHPEFRRGSAEPADVPLPPLARRHWTFFSAESRERAEPESPAAPSAANATASSPTTTKDAPPGPGWRRALRYIRSIGKQ